MRARTYAITFPVEVGCSFALDVEGPTTTFLRTRPSDYVTSDDWLVTETSLVVSRAAVESEQVPGTSGVFQYVERLILPPGRTTVRYRAGVNVSREPDLMPDDARAPRLDRLTSVDWWWLQPTRYCRPDELGAEAWERFGRGLGTDSPPTGRLVRDICSYVNEQMTFEYGSSTPLTSATEAWTQRHGVCRDYNHIAVSFCRALNIPARYAFGYMPDIGVPASTATQDFCAWFEVLLDDAWWTFDARVNEPRIGRVVVGRGRDAADVPLVSTLGPAVMSDFAVVADLLAAKDDSAGGPTSAFRS